MTTGCVGPGSDAPIARPAACIVFDAMSQNLLGEDIRETPRPVKERLLALVEGMEEACR